MIKRLVVITVLLLCSALSHASEGIEESSLLTERAARSYQDMLDVRLIRALVVRNKTGYFFDGAQQRGITYELLKTFEKQINEELGTGNLPVYVSFVPVSRDNLIPALLEGSGDVAAANLTTTPERQQSVDFSIPLYKDVRELLVTGEDIKPLSSIDELSGMSIHVRESSSYHSSLL